MVKIIQIVVFNSRRECREFIYGLGDDGKVYRWKYGKEDWTLDEGKLW